MSQPKEGKELSSLLHSRIQAERQGVDETRHLYQETKRCVIRGEKQLDRVKGV